METQETDIPVRAAELYRQTWQRYSHLLNEAPTLTLKSFCKSTSVNYRGMLKWTRRQGLSVRTRKKGRRKGKTEETIPLEKVHPFVQLVPPQAAVSQSNCLHQVNNVSFLHISAKMCILSQPFGMVLRYSYVTAPEKGKVEQVK